MSTKAQPSVARTGCWSAKFTAGRHPLFGRFILDAELPHAPDRAERGFTSGLERVLDGLAANLPAAGA